MTETSSRRPQTAFTIEDGRTFMFPALSGHNEVAGHGFTTESELAKLGFDLHYECEPVSNDWGCSSFQGRVYVADYADYEEDDCHRDPTMVAIVGSIDFDADTETVRVRDDLLCEGMCILKSMATDEAHSNLEDWEARIAREREEEEARENAIAIMLRGAPIEDRDGLRRMLDNGAVIIV